jgi:hypothetical protein
MQEDANSTTSEKRVKDMAADVTGTRKTHLQSSELAEIFFAIFSRPDIKDSQYQFPLQINL